MRRTLLLCATLTLAGCAPLAIDTPKNSRLAQAATTHEYPSPRAPAQTASGAASPGAAISTFAESYINWTAPTLPGRLRALAADSIGQARSAMQLAAAQTESDYELQRGGVANSGTVEAIAPRAGHRNEYVVVTRELTSATNTTAYQGLRPAWHITVATVTELSPGAWVVSGWQPEG